MNEIMQVLMRRDGLSQQEATEQITEAREAVMDAFESGEDVEEVFMDLFGLEPDYLIDII